jgi:uncharacterized protein (TIGR03437 family)
VLSGDGHVAWAFTATGRLLRIPVDTASSEEILPALPPRLTPGYAGSMPGSDMVLRAPSGISRGLHFSAGDLVYPVADDSDPDSIAVQIPWEAPPQGPPLIVKREGNPFELALQAAANNAVPVIATVPNDHGDPFVKAAQQDFSALISTGNPAPAGSTIHTWFYNLGPLDRSVPTGVPGPSDPPAVPLAHLGCFLLTDWSSPGRALDMPFLAYAPGQIGIYQADITIPADWPNQTGLLICDINGAKTSAWIPIAP